MIWLACLALALAPAQDGVESSVATLLRIPRGGTKLLMRDFDGDGGLDLLLVTETGFGLRLLAEEGYGATDDVSLSFPSAHMAWDVADLDGDGRSEIVALLDGRELRSFELDPSGAFDEGRALFATQSYLPRGVTRLPFVRDVDGDGRADVVVPAAGRYRIHLARAEGGYAAPLALVYEAEVGFEVGDPERLDSRFAQEIRIPWFRIEDVDGDGRPDLVSQTPDEVFFHIAGDVLPAEPTWRLDLEALRAEREQRGGLDLDDLFSNIEMDVEWRIVDLDGKAPRDLVLQVGRNIRVHLGAALEGPRGAPDQILKLSGNLLRFLLRDVEGDERLDLQLARGPRISLGTVIRLLVLPGSLDFDLFTYVNEGGAFARRPTRQNRVTIDIPRLLGFFKELDALDSRIAEQRAIPARRFAYEPDGPAGDIVDLVEGELRIHRGRVSERLQGEAMEGTDGDVDVDELLEVFVLRELDRGGAEDEVTIDLAEISQWHFSAGSSLRAACAGHEPDERIPLAWTGAQMRVHVVRLRADGPPAFFVIGAESGDEGDRYVVQILGARR